jgi:hypothetical protein
MTKTTFTTVTPIPPGVSRETVLETLHDHLEMIDLNPSHESREKINPPPEASPEEYHCTWYQITDSVSYIPGVKGKVHIKCVFNNLANGLQTHVYAPMGLEIKEKWTLGGSLPGEPVLPVEIGFGVPISGLYLREDVELKCNYFLTKFVRKTLTESLGSLVARLNVKSQLVEAKNSNRMTYMSGSPSLLQSSPSMHQHSPNQQYNAPLSPPLTAPMGSPYSSQFNMNPLAQFQGQQPGSHLSAQQNQYGSPHPQYANMASPQQKYAQPLGSPQQQYAQYNPAQFSAVEVDANQQPTPGVPPRSPERPTAPVELA